jgi:hypothetical protein
MNGFRNSESEQSNQSDHTFAHSTTVGAVVTPWQRNLVTLCWSHSDDFVAILEVAAINVVQHFRFPNSTHESPWL